MLSYLRYLARVLSGVVLSGIMPSTYTRVCLEPERIRYYIGKIRGANSAHSGFYVAFAYVYKYLGRTVFDYIVKPVCQSCQVIGVYSPCFLYTDAV